MSQNLIKIFSHKLTMHKKFCECLFCTLLCVWNDFQQLKIFPNYVKIQRVVGPQEVDHTAISKATIPKQQAYGDE